MYGIFSKLSNGPIRSCVSTPNDRLGMYFWDITMIEEEITISILNNLTPAPTLQTKAYKSVEKAYKNLMVSFL